MYVTVSPGDTFGILFYSGRQSDVQISYEADDDVISETGDFASALEGYNYLNWYWAFEVADTSYFESEIIFSVTLTNYRTTVTVNLEIEQPVEEEESEDADDVTTVIINDQEYYEVMDQWYELNHPKRFDLDRLNDMGESLDIVAVTGETIGLLFRSQMSGEFNVGVHYGDDSGLLVVNDRAEAITNGDYWIWYFALKVDEAEDREATLTFSITNGRYANEVTLYMVREDESESTETDESDEEEEEIYEDYDRVMQAYYQLDHHVEIDLGEFDTANYYTETVYAEAGETFGVLFFSTERERGEFAQSRIYLN